MYFLITERAGSEFPSEVSVFTYCLLHPLLHGIPRLRSPRDAANHLVGVVGGCPEPLHRGPALGCPTFLREPGLFKHLARAATTQKNSMNCGKFAPELDFIILKKREEILLGNKNSRKSL